MSGLSQLLINIRKLNNIKRWSNEFLHRRASVAEHSFSVAQIAQMLGFIEESLGGTVNWKALYRKALNHDVPEALTGDVISTTKNINDHTRETMKQVETQLVNEALLDGVFSPFREEYLSLIFDGKDSSLEGDILRYADHIDALIECLQEIRLGNNDPFAAKYVDIMKKIDGSEARCVQYFVKEVLCVLINDRGNKKDE
ncbi:MAG: HD domain-containing protein [Deferribacteraceae bacterium]|nr:HD domain-containing protein [Deferribacteraceae bacterium]